jgi:hypothetical protein
MAVSKPIRAALRGFVVSGLTPAAADSTSGHVLLAESERQGLVGLLAAAPGFLEALPEGVRGRWTAAARAQFVRGVLQLDLGARAMRALDDAGLRALPLKGAALAGRLYATPGDRPMADVDLLVLDDPVAAERALGALGFTRVERADHALALRETRSGGILELHRSFTSCPGLFPVDADGLWARREDRPGVVPRAPALEDLLVAAALHAAFQHGFALSLVQFLDFRRLLEASPDLDRTLAAAAASRAEGALLLSLAAARAVVGAPFPEDWRRALEARAPAALGRRAQALEGRDPLALFAPEAPALAPLRLALAHGRRLELVSLTLSPPAWPGESRPGRAARVRASLRRLVRIVSREVGPRLLAGPTSAPVAAPGPTAAPVETVEPSPAERSALLRASLGAFEEVRFRVTGACMQPALLDGETVRVTGAALRVPRFGDVVLVDSREGPRLHRLVFSWAGRMRTRGDASFGFDGPRRSADAFGTVLGVERGPALVSTSSPGRALASLATGLWRRAFRAFRAA